MWIRKLTLRLLSILTVEVHKQSHQASMTSVGRVRWDTVRVAVGAQHLSKFSFREWPVIREIRAKFKRYTVYIVQSAIRDSNWSTESKGVLSRRISCWCTLRCPMGLGSDLCQSTCKRMLLLVIVAFETLMNPCQSVIWWHCVKFLPTCACPDLLWLHNMPSWSKNEGIPESIDTLSVENHLSNFWVGRQDDSPYLYIHIRFR